MKEGEEAKKSMRGDKKMGDKTRKWGQGEDNERRENRKWQKYSGRYGN